MNFPRIQSLCTFLGASAFLLGCSSPPAEVITPPQSLGVGPDPHSYARPDEARVEHLSLDLAVDFATSSLQGTATLHLAKGAGDRLILDTRDLTIHNVTVGDETTTWHLGPAEHDFLGQPLVIDLPTEAAEVTVHYRTSPDAGALLWVDGAQTQGGKPFLFSQSQALLARTWIPLQDSPALRITYDAKLQVPSDLLALMSADGNPTTLHEDGVYQFSMKQPIPSYLLALAVGDVEFAPLGDRSGVYAESGMIEAAANEFADTEEMMTAVEALYGPYGWGRYDILVLPASFPFGGMENPKLTFATPTIIAGDRSLVSLIAHELAHSWSGNLVTNETWNDFWLNEGFTVYLERRIMEALEGRPYSEMLAVLGRQDLDHDVAAEAPRDTHLRLDLEGREADDGMTDIAYEKGYFFLRLLEESLGREKWDSFLRDYFSQHAFGTMTTDDFLLLLDSGLFADDPQWRTRLQVDAWVDGPGLPDNMPKVEAIELAKVETQIQRFESGTPARRLRVRRWTTHHWLHFLRNLKTPINSDQLQDLTTTFELEKRNAEIRFAWLILAIRSDYEPAWPFLEDFLMTIGRRKFVAPLFGAMAQTEGGRQRAEEIYEKSRGTYHPVTVQTIDGILKR